jgi:diguanylate cyclase (GGDEF)-like protein/PAS domain S-box-containing protein
MLRIHSTISLFTLFIALLGGGLFYYIDMSKAEQQYTHTRTKIMNLKFLDRDFDNFFYQYAFFSNFDHINQDIKRFEYLLMDLQKETRKLEGDQRALDTMLLGIQKSFDERVQAIEYFKSKKSTLINSIHFLYDLHATIKEDSSLSLPFQNQIQETLFLSIQFLVAEYTNVKRIKDNIATIQNYANRQPHRVLLTFSKQNRLFLSNILHLKKLTKEAVTHRVAPSLEILDHTIAKLYSESMSIQQTIALLLFGFSLIALLILIFLQARFLRSKRELQAFKYAVEHSDNTIVLTDTNKNITYVNDVFESNTGYSKDEALGQNPRILNSGKQDDAYYKVMHERLSRGENWQGEFINKRKDGTLYYERASIVPIYLDNELINYLAIKLDITKYIEQNLELQQAASLFENTEEAILITDTDNRISKINKAFCTMYGYTPEEVLGKDPNIIRSDKHDKHYFSKMWKEITNTGAWRGKIYNRSKTGEVIPIWMTIKVIYNHLDNISSYTAIQTDLREIEASQAKAKYLAYNDPLCNLPNRIGFEQSLNEHLEKAKNYHEPFALLFIDLDRLKVINDTLGHSMGDYLLKSISQRLASTLKPNDHLARWGGDEFVYLLNNVKTRNEIITRTDAILESIKKSITLQERHLTTTASIGIARFPQDATEADQLIKYADSAMYHAKDLGKNNYQFYTHTLSQEIQRRLDIELALRKALDNNELYLVYQPQYELKSRTIHSLEALIRWESPTLGSISPAEFIPIAEDTGLIAQIGYFVFEEATKGFLEIRQSGIDIQRIGINVSSVQFRDPHLVKRFASIATEQGLQPQNIEIEITERYIMEQNDANYQLINALREEGFKISIDDFGTGYSSMSYFSKLPLDAIKIDKSFVDDIGTKGKESEVIRAIIALSKTFNYSLIAEGIEHSYQEKFLLALGCDLGQGYLFDKPLSKNEIIQKYA